MGVTDPRLLRALETAKAAGLEVDGFEVGPRLIRIKVRGSVASEPKGSFDAWLTDAKAKARLGGGPG